MNYETITLKEMKQFIKKMEKENGNIDSIPIFINAYSGGALDVINPDQLKYLQLEKIKKEDPNDNLFYSVVEEDQSTDLRALIFSIEE